MLRVAKWNFDRNNTSFDLELEVDMLAEEAQEFKDGLVDYFNSIKTIDKLAVLNAKVELVDAWADFVFVAEGTKFKSLGRMMDLNGIDATGDYMYNILVKDLQIKPSILALALDAVVSANEAKGTEKVNGKIQKGAEWVDPKFTIAELLSV